MAEKKQAVPDNRLRSIISYMLSFFLAVFLLVAAVFPAAYAGIFIQDGFLSILDDYYYYVLKDYADTQVYFYTFSVIIDTKAADDFFKEEEIRRDTEGYIRAAFSGREYDFDLSSLRERIFESSLEYTDDEAYIEEYADGICDIYKNSIMMPGLKALVQLKNSYTAAIIACIAAAVLISSFVIMMLIKLHRKDGRGLMFITCSIWGAAFMAVFIPLILYFTGSYAGLSLQPYFFYVLGTNIVKRLLKLCVFAGVILAAAGLATFISYFRTNVRPDTAND